MEKWRQIKKNHHYVWAHYLSGWATKGNVYYLTKRGKVACDSIKGLCRAREFYAINRLLPEDVAFIQRWIDKASGFLQEQHRKDLADFIRLSQVWGHISNSDQFKDISDIEEVIRCNSLENKYAVIESEFYPVIELIKSQGISALDSTKNMIILCSYVGHQVTRTKSFRDRSIKAIRQDMQNFHGVEGYVHLLERNWWVLSYILGTNVGAGLFLSRDSCHHILIKNNTKKPFITGGHPVVNVHECVGRSDIDNPPDHMDLWFPIGPDLAYMVNESSNYDHLKNSINEQEVEKFNVAVARQSEGLLIGSTSEIIKEIRSRIGETA